MSAPVRDPTFHLFPQLPLELRQEVWRYCLPHRVCELDSPMDDILFDLDPEESQSPCKLFHTSYMNGRPPVISRVCHEARSVAFETGSVPTEFAPDRPQDTAWVSGTSLTDTWEDTARDSAHLNWTAVYEPMYGSSGSPLHCLAWQASHVSGTGSMMIEYIDYNYGSPNALAQVRPVGPPISTPLSSSRVRDLDAFKWLSSWLIVMRVVILHSDFQTAAATGLFGLLGDSRVLIVDVSEETRLNALFELAEACERQDPVAVGQNLRGDSVDLMRQKLKDTVMSAFRSEELAAKLRPAIMFRLCTQNCNDQGSILSHS